MNISECKSISLKKNIPFTGNLWPPDTITAALLCALLLTTIGFYSGDLVSLFVVVLICFFLIGGLCYLEHPRKERRFAIWLFLTGTLVSLCFTLVTQFTLKEFLGVAARWDQSDEFWYWKESASLANAWVKGEHYPLPPASFYGYLYFLGGVAYIVKFIGATYTAAIPRVVNCFLVGMIACYAHLIAREILPRSLAKKAARTTIGVLFLAYYASMIYRDILIVAISMAMLWQFFQLWHRRQLLRVIPLAILALSLLLLRDYNLYALAGAIALYFVFIRSLRFNKIPTAFLLLGIVLLFLYLKGPRIERIAEILFRSRLQRFESHASSGSLGIRLIKFPNYIKIPIGLPYFYLAPFPGFDFGVIIGSEAFNPLSILFAISTFSWYFLLPSTILGIGSFWSEKSELGTIISIICTLILVVIFATSLDPRHKLLFYAFVGILSARGKIHPKAKSIKKFYWFGLLGLYIVYFLLKFVVLG